MSNQFDVFGSKFSNDIYLQKYSLDGQEKWADTCARVTNAVCGQLLPSKDKEMVYKYMYERKFIPGGRYLYASGRPFHQVNNCFLFRAEDSREGWSEAAYKAAAALMTGGGIGFNYSNLREEGAIIKRTGGKSTGPLALINIINELGRYVMQGGQRRCLPKGSLVHTKNGLIKIEKLTTNDEVLTKDGFKKVKGLLDQGIQNTVKIVTQNGEFVCTPNHKVAVLSNIEGDYIWVEASKLKEGTRLLHTSDSIEGKVTKLPDSIYIRPKNAYTSKDITIPNLDSDMAWFIGYFHANGHSRITINPEKPGKRNSVVQVAIPKDAPQVKNKVINQLSRFGTNVVEKDGDGECWNVKTTSIPLALWIQEYIKKSNTNIEIPDFILEGTLDIRSAYIAGMMDGDGSVKGRPVIVTNTVYPEYAKQLQSLIASLGIVTRFHLNRPPIGNWKALYRVTLKGSKQVLKFKDTVGRFLIYKNDLPEKRKSEQFSYSYPGHMIRECSNKNLKKDHNYSINFPVEKVEDEIGYKNFTPIEVLDIEEYVELQTYDIEVDERNEFYCNGLLVHNSAIYASLGWFHPDIFKFIHSKDHSEALKEAKLKDFNFPLPMELTNISVDYNTEFFIAIEDPNHSKHEHSKKVWLDNCRQAFSTAEPGMAFNFRKDNENLRNACVTGDTEILTNDGYQRIDSLVNTPTLIWNGFEWSEVTPKVTGTNQEILTITFSDGRNLTCTKNHKFHISKNYRGDVEIVEAKDLESGMKLIKNEFPILDNMLDLENAYTQGFVSAEGMELNRTLYIYKPKEMCLERIQDKKIVKWEENNNRYRIILNKTPMSKKFVPMEYSVDSKLKWLSGLFDGDGTELKEGGLQLVSVDREFLKDLQKLLTTLGIQSKIVPAAKAGMRMLPNHKGGYEEYYCQEAFRVCVGAVQMQKLKELGLKCERMSFDKQPQRDASQFVTVVDVTESGIADKVYCFNEPKRHLGIFNGVVTGQCTEVVSEDDSDKCNLGTVWMNRCKDKKEFADVVKYSTLFLLCGGIYSDVPNEKIKEVGLKNNRIGLGLGGMHEWLMTRGFGYEVTPELHKWLSIYEQESDGMAFIGAKQLGVSVPKGVRAIAPTGTIGILANTTTGIEPLFCKAYLRRYYKDGKWLSQYVVDGSVKRLLDIGVKLEDIQDSYDLSFKERVKFQADVQNYVDMAISSTCNLPQWGSENNNEQTLKKYSDILLKYSKRLRGFTVYPDGSRGGQPLTPVSLDVALKDEGKVFEEKEMECINGVCGI